MAAVGRYDAIAKGERLRDCPGRPARRRPPTAKDRAMTILNLLSSPRTAPARRPRASVAALAALALLVLPAVSGCTKESSSQPAAADPTDTVVARVKGVEIRQSDLAFAEEEFSNELRGAPPDGKREQLIAYLTDVILVSHAAETK